MQPVLEVRPLAGFALWPVAPAEPFGYLALGSDLTPLEVGAAVMSLAGVNDLDLDPEHDDRPPRPADALGAFLHGLLTVDSLYAPGGLRVTDTTTGVVFQPGCCTGLEDRRDWHLVFEPGSETFFGHDPWPRAERDGETVRLTLDAEQTDSPLIDVPAADLVKLLADAERDLLGFLVLAAEWAARQLPHYATAVTAALGRALDVPGAERVSGPARG
ncbi:hypothetical protein VSH64_45180 [Amycolatopsis rhabdoformis]|uniref:SUKH-4 immunity protein of toxin-antitoxin system n=1 Tax=Amycolatopsis rhabdoformis TaxID=1448059 RepID=A0ABZ1ILJ9_9PSEU|nr:hypothetical protein [Amycolatopsis rhabdoformis]WSE35415.1 hypothetical protein VSH64_45180 [Amycolatopsis rhabdoformis]